MTQQLETKEAETAETEMPDWVLEMPEDNSYCLTMYEGDGASIQQIECNREEYLTLKHHLAVLRGYLEDNKQ